MRPIEKQILENQYAIMLKLINQERDEFDIAFNNTFELLNPTNEEDCCEMPEENDAFVSKEVKK